MNSPDGTSPRAHAFGLPPRIALGFGAALVCLVAAAAASYAALGARNAASQLVGHTAAAKLALEEVESALLVSHLALEAEVAAGDLRHRARFLSASSRVQPALLSLQRVAEEHPEEQPRVARVVADAALVRAGQARAVALVDAGDLAAARRLSADREGREVLARVMATLDQIEAEEERAHVGRETAWRRTVLVSNAIFAGAVCVLLALIVLAARLVRDDIRRLEREGTERARALLVQQRLMAVVSHDLRNPLAGIFAAARMLVRLDLPGNAATIAKRVVGACGRMERLVCDLLDWSRTQGGAPVPISAREADLHDVCLRIADELGARDPDRVRVERAGDTRACFDPDRLEQVVGNLLSNALRYATPGTPVLVRAVGTPREVRVEVQDDGPGIPPAAQAELFEPFRQGPSGDRGGLGLGLFIVRAITEAHGGRVELASAPSKTTFAVHLPRAPPAVEAGPPTG